jgi:acetate kinase
VDVTNANTLVNKFSGMIGITGVSSDMREIEQAAESGNERAQLGLDMYHYRVRKYIGSYAAAMNGVDVVVFTGGIGENGPESREEMCKGFEFMGLEFDADANRGKRGKELIISKPGSRVIAMVVPTNEELVIARDTQEIIAKKK